MPLERRVMPATWLVTSTADTLSDQPVQSGTLRWAIDSAQNGDTVDFAPSLEGATIQLQGYFNTLNITHDIRIQGFSNGGITVSGIEGGGDEAVGSNGFMVAKGVTATLSGLTISNCEASYGEGGAITNFGNLTLQQCVISKNLSYVGAPGVFNAGQLVLDHVDLANNEYLALPLKGFNPGSQTANGGAIYSTSGSSLNVLNSSFENNSAQAQAFFNAYAYGGAIYTLGATNISNSTFEGNSVSAAADDQNTAQGGALYANTDRLSIWASTFANNAVEPDGASLSPIGTPILQGGALWQTGSTITTIVNSTFSSNSVTAPESGDPNGDGYDAGGTIYNGGGLVSIQQSTVYGGTVTGTANSGGNIFTDPTGWATRATVTALFDSIVAGGREDYISSSNVDTSSPSDIQGYVESLGYNLIQSLTGITAFNNDVTGNIYGQDPRLGPLQNNGGYTSTMALLSGSPAIEAGSYLSPVDQRGVARTPADTSMGAYQSPLMPTTWIVTNTEDSINDEPDIVGSLRWAIDKAKDGDTVEFAPSLYGSTIPLQGYFNSLVIAHDITIQGFADGAVTILGSDQGDEGLSTDAFVVDAGVTATISGLTISDAQGLYASGGGAITNMGNLTVEQCVISNNTSYSVTGGIYNSGQLVLDHVDFENNTVLGIAQHGESPVSQSCDGGAIYSTIGSYIDILNCTFNDNAATASAYSTMIAYGGAIYTLGTTNISNSTFSNNSATASSNSPIGGLIVAYAEGGAIFAETGDSDRFSIWASTFVSNSVQVSAATTEESQFQATAEGGAIWQFGNYITTIVNSTFSANSATAPDTVIPPNSEGIAFPYGATLGYAEGGTIYNGGGLVSIQQSTISGGSVNYVIADSNLSNPVISSPTGGGNIYTDPTGWATRATVTALLDSIVAGGREDYIADGLTYYKTPSDISGYVESLGNNLVQSNAEVVAYNNNVTGNIYGQDPKLGPLQNNGGYTSTMALLPGSPAIGAGSFLSPVDQRGLPRYFGDTDIGSYQTQPI